MAHATLMSIFGSVKRFSPRQFKWIPVECFGLFSWGQFQRSLRNFPQTSLTLHRENIKENGNKDVIWYHDQTLVLINPTFPLIFSQNSSSLEKIYQALVPVTVFQPSIKHLEGRLKTSEDLDKCLIYYWNMTFRRTRFLTFNLMVEHLLLESSDDWTQ